MTPQNKRTQIKRPKNQSWEEMLWVPVLVFVSFGFILVFLCISAGKPKAPRVLVGFRPPVVVKTNQNSRVFGFAAEIQKTRCKTKTPENQSWEEMFGASDRFFGFLVLPMEIHNQCFDNLCSYEDRTM